MALEPGLSRDVPVFLLPANYSSRCSKLIRDPVEGLAQSQAAILSGAALGVQKAQVDSQGTPRRALREAAQGPGANVLFPASRQGKGPLLLLLQVETWRARGQAKAPSEAAVDC